jgi:hypothetical protein
MSLALASDAAAADGPRLWWLTDTGQLASSRGRGFSVAQPWTGIAAHADRLLLWNATELHLVDASSQESRLVSRDSYTDIDRAGWGDDDTVEIYSHETSGHPTDRSGHRAQVKLSTMKWTTLAFRQGIAPPWGSRGHVAQHGDICSGPEGVARQEWHEGAYRFWWRRPGRGGRRRLPDALRGFASYRLLTGNGVTYVCALQRQELALFDVSGERVARKLRAPAHINDAVFHDGALFLAMRGREPETA